MKYNGNLSFKKYSELFLILFQSLTASWASGAAGQAVIPIVAAAWRVDRVTWSIRQPMAGRNARPWSRHAAVRATVNARARTEPPSQPSVVRKLIDFLHLHITEPEATLKFMPGCVSAKLQFILVYVVLQKNCSKITSKTYLKGNISTSWAMAYGLIICILLFNIQVYFIYSVLIWWVCFWHTHDIHTLVYFLLGSYQIYNCLLVSDRVKMIMYFGEKFIINNWGTLTF